MIVCNEAQDNVVKRYRKLHTEERKTHYRICLIDMGFV